MSSRSGVALLPILAAAVLAGCDRQSAPAPQASATPAQPAAPTAGMVDRSHKGEAAPAAVLTDLAGKPVPLTGAGPVLVNLWATWCAPCVAELPTLDRAAAALAGRVAVVAVDQGEDAAKVQAFLKGKPLAHARPLLDKGMAVSLKLAANLPTTILYDAAGREVWRVSGGREWDSPESLKVIGEAG